MIARREGEISAFNTLTEDLAREAARAVDDAVRRGEDPGPLAGVPVALKDNLCTRGSRRPVPRGSWPVGGRRTTPLSWSAWSPRAGSSSARPTWTSSPWVPPRRTRRPGPR
ncbi:MAG: amidase family protein [Microthrixaceae bacterium]